MILRAMAHLPILLSLVTAGLVSCNLPQMAHLNNPHDPNFVAQPSPSSYVPSVYTLAGIAGADYAEGIGSAARFNFPSGIASDGTYLYIADQNNNRLRKIDPISGAVSLWAGSGTAGNASGTGAAASFDLPTGISYDGNGSMYIADYTTSSIRKSDGSAYISNVTTMTSSSHTDGAFSIAQFDHPQSLAAFGSAIYVADFGNNCVRQIDFSSGLVSTLAGPIGSAPGYQDGTGSSALFNQPQGIATDGSYVYLSDSNNHCIRRIRISDGQVITLAGNPTYSGYADGIGLNAKFYQPCGLTLQGNNLFVADFNNHCIRKIDLNNNEVSTYAGVPGSSGSGDGLVTIAKFNGPFGLTFMGSALYVTDYQNHEIRVIK